MGDVTKKLDLNISKAASVDEAIELLKSTPTPPTIIDKIGFLLDRKDARMREEARKNGLKEQSYTLSKLQADVNISRSTFYNIARGKGKLDRNSIIKIAYTLDASLDEMNELLKIAGHKEIYSRELEGTIIMYGLLHKLSVDEIDAELKKNNCDLRFLSDDYYAD